MCFSGSPVCPATAVCLSSVLPTSGTLQYVGDQQRLGVFGEVLKDRKTFMKLDLNIVDKLEYRCTYTTKRGTLQWKVKGS